MPEHLLSFFSRFQSVAVRRRGEVLRRPFLLVLKLILGGLSANVGLEGNAHEFASFHRGDFRVTERRRVRLVVEGSDMLELGVASVGFAVHRGVAIDASMQLLL